MSGQSGNQLVLFSLESGNVRTLGKTKRIPSGSDIKCIMLSHTMRVHTNTDRGAIMVNLLPGFRCMKIRRCAYIQTTGKRRALNHPNL